MEDAERIKLVQPFSENLTIVQLKLPAEGQVSLEHVGTSPCKLNRSPIVFTP